MVEILGIPVHVMDMPPGVDMALVSHCRGRYEEPDVVWLIGVKETTDAEA